MDSIIAHLRVPSFWPEEVDLWFKLPEVQFDTARITSDQEKYQAVIANLDRAHARLIRDVFDASPATGRYEHVKKELIKRLGESDAKRLRQVLENEQMGDRKPSQFYRDLRNLATNSLADDVILTVWEGRLPSRVRSILAFVQNRDPETRTQIADSIYEASPEQGQIAVASAVRHPTITHPPGQNSGINDAVAAALNAIYTQINEIRAQIAELRINEHRRSRSQTRSGTQFRPRSRPRDQPRQNGLCYYHAQFRENARKCTSPCSWNSGNGTSRP